MNQITQYRQKEAEAKSLGLEFFPYTVVTSNTPRILLNIPQLAAVFWQKINQNAIFTLLSLLGACAILLVYLFICGGHWESCALINRMKYL